MTRAVLRLAISLAALIALPVMAAPPAPPLLLPPVVDGGAEPETACEATGTGVCYYIDDIAGTCSGGDCGAITNPFRLGDMPTNEGLSSCNSSNNGNLPDFHAGDVLYFRGGVYPISTSYSPTTGCLAGPNWFYGAGNGTEENPITVRAYPHETAILRRASGSGVLMASTRDQSNVNMVDHLTIKGLTFDYVGLHEPNGTPNYGTLTMDKVNEKLTGTGMFKNVSVGQWIHIGGIDPIFDKPSAPGYQDIDNPQYDALVTAKASDDEVTIRQTMGWCKGSHTPTLACTVNGDCPRSATCNTGTGFCTSVAVRHECDYDTDCDPTISCKLNHPNAPDENGNGDEYVIPAIKTTDPDARMIDLAQGVPGRENLNVRNTNHLKLMYNSFIMMDHPFDGANSDNHDSVYMEKNYDSEVGYNIYNGPGGDWKHRCGTNNKAQGTYRTYRSSFHDNHFQHTCDAIIGKAEFPHNTVLRNWVSDPATTVTRLATGCMVGGTNNNGETTSYLYKHNVCDDNGIGSFDGPSRGIVITENEFTRAMLSDINSREINNGVYDLGGHQTVSHFTLTNNRVGLTTANTPDSGFNAVAFAILDHSMAEKSTMFDDIGNNCWYEKTNQPGNGPWWSWWDPGTSSVRRFPWNNGTSSDQGSMEPTSTFIPFASLTSPPGAACPANTGVPPAIKALVKTAARYGPTALTNWTCSDGNDNDHDGHTDYPEDTDCTGATGNSEGLGNPGNRSPVWSGTSSYTVAKSTSTPSNVQMVSSWTDPDGDALKIYWEMITTSDNADNPPTGCKRWVKEQTSTNGNMWFSDTTGVANNLIADPVVENLPTLAKTCQVKTWAWDGKGDAVTKIITITTQ